MKTEAANSFETLTTTYQTTGRHIQNDINLYSHHRQNLKYCPQFSVLRGQTLYRVATYTHIRKSLVILYILMTRSEALLQCVKLQLWSPLWMPGLTCLLAKATWQVYEVPWQHGGFWIRWHILLWVHMAGLYVTRGHISAMTVRLTHVCMLCDCPGTFRRNTEVKHCCYIGWTSSRHVNDFNTLRFGHFTYQ